MNVGATDEFDSRSVERRAARASLVAAIAKDAGEVVKTAQSLIRVPSENPSGDTRQIAELAADMLRRIDDVEVEFVTGREPFVNVVARVKGATTGRRIVLNGHLDTYPIGDRSLWTVDPLGGAVVDGRLYGRGAADMKGGIAASLNAFRLLAGFRHAWGGELVLTLAADEESMGRWGSAYLLANVPHATGDALVCGDAGSPMVIRFGEKGFLWLELQAKGKASHGAHVHLGRNALDLLIQATQRIQSLAMLPIDTPEKVARAIDGACAVSEPLAGAGETNVLTSVTVNLGTVQGGTSPNLVPGTAKAALDIRLPVGISSAQILSKIVEMLAPLEGLEFKVLARHDPTCSDPDDVLFKVLRKNGEEALGSQPVVNMRVGASDTRLFRSYGIPSAVYGCTPYNMGGPDEYALLEDLQAVFRVHTLTAFDLLSTGVD